MMTALNQESDSTSVRNSGVGRLRNFSDAVLAIVLTILVLDLLPTAAASPGRLLSNWPTYLAYFAAFLTIGSFWLNHNEAMPRIRKADPIVLLLNLALLFGASLVPWPTALIAMALKKGDRADQIAAIVVFAVITILIGLPWAVLERYLARHPELLHRPSDVKWMRWHARSSAISLLLAPASVALSFALPIASFVLYVMVLAAFIMVRVRAACEASSAERNLYDTSWVPTKWPAATNGSQDTRVRVLVRSRSSRRNYGGSGAETLGGLDRSKRRPHQRLIAVPCLYSPGRQRTH